MREKIPGTRHVAIRLQNCEKWLRDIILEQCPDFTPDQVERAAVGIKKTGLVKRDYMMGRYTSTHYLALEPTTLRRAAEGYGA